MDAIDRLPQTGAQGVHLKQKLQDKLVEHRQYINKNGQDMPEIRNWKRDSSLSSSLNERNVLNTCRFVDALTMLHRPSSHLPFPNTVIIL